MVQSLEETVSFTSFRGTLTSLDGGDGLNFVAKGSQQDLFFKIQFSFHSKV
jgi:hypothetical protein